jgi:hypothetical protein
MGRQRAHQRLDNGELLIRKVPMGQWTENAQSATSLGGRDACSRGTDAQQGGATCRIKRACMYYTYRRMELGLAGTVTDRRPACSSMYLWVCPVGMYCGRIASNKVGPSQGAHAATRAGRVQQQCLHHAETLQKERSVTLGPGAAQKASNRASKQG